LGFWVYCLAMNRPGSDPSDRTELKTKLIGLRDEHRDLDEAISALVAEGPVTQVPVQRLKKRKLAIKDQISRIEAALLPDIIA
jgi:hypothetical protein